MLRKAEITVGGLTYFATQQPDGAVWTDDSGHEWVNRPDGDGDLWWVLNALECSLDGCPHTFPHYHRGDDELVRTPIAKHPDGGYMGAATVVNGGQEVNLRDMLTEPWQPALAERLAKTLGRKYLAHQLVSMLPADVALRLVDRVDEVVERKVAEEVERIHHDVDGAVTTTLARLAEQADTKRRELSRERFTGHTRLN